ncbi:hypothetical protein D3C71_1864920 [compost metagenome]
MDVETLKAEIESLRLDLEYLSGIAQAQTLVIRELLRASPESRERMAKYQAFAEGTNHGGTFSAEQLKAMDMTLRSVVSQK